MRRSNLNIRQLSLTALVIILAFTSTGCQFSLIQLPSWLGGEDSTATPDIPSGPTATPMPMAQVTFIAVLPEPLAAGESLAIALLDEVTGLALNNTTMILKGAIPAAVLAIVVEFLFEVIEKMFVPKHLQQKIGE